jgi:hypothetical protein
VARFLAITLALPLRRLRGSTVSAAANFRVPLRLRVLAEVLVRLPGTLVQRWMIGRRSVVSRRSVWRDWAGR